MRADAVDDVLQLLAVGPRGVELSVQLQAQEHTEEGRWKVGTVSKVAWYGDYRAQTIFPARAVSGDRARWPGDDARGRLCLRCALLSLCVTVAFPLPSFSFIVCLVMEYDDAMAAEGGGASGGARDSGGAV